TDTIASTAIAVRSILALPALAVLYIYVQIANLNVETRQAAFIIALAFIINSCGGIIVATFQGREQMSLVTIGSVVSGALSLALAILIRLLHGGIVAFAATSALVALVMLMVYLHWMRDFARLRWRVSRHDMREVIVGSLTF